MCIRDSHFNAEESIGRQMAKDLEKQFEEKEQKMIAIVKAKLLEVEKDRKELDLKKQRENELFIERLEKEKSKILEQLKNQHDKEFQLKLFTAENERKELEERLEKLTRAAIENEQLKRKMDGLQTEIELKLQEKFSQEASILKEKIRQEEQKRTELSLSLIHI